MNILNTTNLTLNDFRKVAGSADSIGYVTGDGQGKLQKTAAHRTWKSLNATVADSAANAQIRRALYDTIRSALGPETELTGTQQDFLRATARQLGIELKGNAVCATGQDALVSQNPLERRTIRAILHQTDLQLSANKAAHENAMLSKAERTLVGKLTPATVSGLSSDDRKALLGAFLSLKGSGALTSTELTLDGQHVWLSAGTGGDISLEFENGRSVSLGKGNALRDAAVDVIVREAVPNPKARTKDLLLLALSNTDTVPGQLRGPGPVRTRALAQKVLLTLCGPGTPLGGKDGLSEGDLLTICPSYTRDLAIDVLNGGIKDGQDLRAKLKDLQIPDMINSEDVLELVDAFDSAGEEEQDLVRTLGETKVKEPVGMLQGLFRGTKAVVGSLFGKFGFGSKEPDKALEPGAVKNMLADLIHEDNTVEADRLRGKPGALLAYSLGKHTYTLAYLLCNPGKEAFENLPEAYRDVACELVSRIRENEEFKTRLGAVGLMAEPGSADKIAKLLDGALATGLLTSQLAAVEKEIDTNVKSQFLLMQAMIRQGFQAMLKGDKVDLEEFRQRLIEADAELAKSEPDLSLEQRIDLAAALVQREDALRKERNELADTIKSGGNSVDIITKSDAELHREALTLAKADLARSPEPDALVSEDLKEIGRHEGYKSLTQMMDEAGLPHENLDDNLGDITDPAQLNTQKNLRLHASRQMLDKLCGDGATDLTKGYGAFMVKAMNSYFSGMSVDDQRNMLAAGIRYAPDRASGEALLGAMLKGAGPIMQKMLQGLSSMGTAPEFQAALKDMKSNLAPIPDNIVKANLLDMVKRSNGRITGIRVTEALGAASVGQAFFCTATLADGSTKDVVVKMLRPDAEQRAKREAEIFLAAARQVPGMEVTFAGQLASIMDELDLRVEAQNTKAGDVYDKGDASVKSMKCSDLIAPTRYTLVLERAPGRPVDKLIDKVRKDLVKATSKFFNFEEVTDERGNPVLDGDGKPKLTRTPKKREEFQLGPDEILQDVAEAEKELTNLYETTLVQQQRLMTLADKWCRQGIFESGFYHGDLHAGNIMVDDTFVRDKDGNLDLTQNGGLTVIDYGNATKLSKDQQTAVVRMMAAASVKDTNLFIKGMKSLMTPQGRREMDRLANRVHDAIHNIFNLGTMHETGSRIWAVLQELQKMGFELPGPIFKFSQCQIRLQGTIDQLNALLNEISRERANFREQQMKYDDATTTVDPCADLFNRLVSSNTYTRSYAAKVIKMGIDAKIRYRDTPSTDPAKIEGNRKLFLDANAIPPGQGKHTVFGGKLTTPKQTAIAVITHLAAPDAKTGTAQREAFNRLVTSLDREFPGLGLQNLYTAVQNDNDTRLLDEAMNALPENGPQRDQELVKLKAKGGLIETVGNKAVTFGAAFEKAILDRLDKLENTSVPNEARWKNLKEQPVKTFFDAIGTVIEQNLLASANKLGYITGLATVYKSKQEQNPV